MRVLCLLVLVGGCMAFMPPPVLALDEPNQPTSQERVKGRIVVRFNLPADQIKTRPGPTKSAALGIASLDAIAAEHNVHQIIPMFPGAEPVTYRGRIIDLSRYYSVRFDEDVDLDAIVNAYQEDPNVELAEAAAVGTLDLTPNDSKFPIMWHLEQPSDFDINAPEAWDIQTGDSSIIVAILDLGIRYYHKDLGGVNASPSTPEASRGNMWVNRPELPENGGQAGVDDDNNGYIDDWIGWDFANYNNNPSPGDYGHPHGTKVAGAVAAINNNGLGVSSVAGGWNDGSQSAVSSGVRIMAIEGLSADIAGSGLYYASVKGARIANLSTSYGISGTPQSFKDAAAYFMANGGLIFTSAGNDHTSIPPDWMAEQDDIMSVGSSHISGARSSFSNYGSWCEISAPGEDVWTTSFCCPPPHGDVYIMVRGTSIASPMAAGVAALFWSHYPDWTADQVRTQLFCTAAPNSWTRHGEVDAYGMFKSDTVNVPGDYTTIQEAIDAACNLSIIMVDSGTYNELINFNGKNLTVESVEGPRFTKITNSAWAALVTFENDETAEAVLDGFTLEGAGWGIHIKDAYPTIHHCILRDQGKASCGAVTLEGATPGSWGRCPATFINNTIINAAGGGFLSYSTKAPTIKNCIVAFNDEFGIKHAGPSNHHTKPILSYNDVYGNDSDYVNISDTGIVPLSVDPLVWANGTLKFGSPCIDAGDPDPIYNDPDGSRNDIGGTPYEIIVLPPPRRPKDMQSGLPTVYSLSQNRPNPFNPTTEIDFALPQPGQVKLEVHNILGQHIATIVNGHLPAGEHSYTWNGSDVASGVYVYRLTAQDFTASKKMMLLK